MELAGEDSSNVKAIWDVPLDILFSLALQFYKKEKDMIKLGYNQKIRLMAYYKQEKLGPYLSEKDTETGMFDVVGADRRKAWKELGQMSKEAARRGLVSLLDAATPHFHEFILGAMPKSCEKPKRMPVEEAGTHNHVERDESVLKANGKQDQKYTKEHLRLKSALAPASLWCTPHTAKNFVAEVKDLPQCCLVVGPGKTAEVKVPSSEEASAIVWMFVTEMGDIGFGLGFQPEECKGGPPIELLPIVKRDCSEDLVIGSHHYQLPGIYALHFDNSHSLTISKTLYYRVFYQKL